MKETGNFKQIRDNYIYYFVIGLVSFLSVSFLPFIGSSAGLGWNLPETKAAWVVWVSVRIIIAIINVVIFYSFMEQAKLNIRENENYKNANKILANIKDRDKKIPRGPNKWNRQQYSKKGTSIFAGSFLATVALTQAILTYDWVSMLSYIFTIIMGLVFGVMQMKNAEKYWTVEYYEYALMKKEEQENVRDKWENIQESSGTSSEE